jgi:cytochrome P450 family 6
LHKVSLKLLPHNDETQMHFSAFVFFIAAFESTSSTMALCLYELSKNEKLQRKVQMEIDKVLEARGNSEFDFEMLSELKFLENCIDETLRKYPPAPFLIRECGKEYRVPGSEFVIEKGTPMIISTFGIQRDPEFFPDPQIFDPDRFSDENIHKIQQFSYLPFGAGPRVCIGQRFGKLTTRLGLFLLLQRFNFSFSDETVRELRFSPKQFVLTLMDDIHLKVVPREH